MNLSAQLTEVRENSAKNIPAELLEQMLSATEDLKAKHLEDFAPKKGDDFPQFTLMNQKGHDVSLKSKLAEGAAIITFYRGGWCPYCNLELRAYQKELSEIKALGANLIAITPELPDSSLTTIEKNELQFEVLSDPKSEFSKALGIVFTVPENIQTIYKGFGIDLEAHNGDGQFELPLAATFVVNKDGKVIFADVSADYTHRAEPADVIAALKSI